MTRPLRPSEPSCVVTTTSTSGGHELGREDAGGVAGAVDQDDALALRDGLVGQPEQRRDADAAADEQQVLPSAAQRVAAAERPPGEDLVAGVARAPARPCRARRRRRGWRTRRRSRPRAGGGSSSRAAAAGRPAARRRSAALASAMGSAQRSMRNCPGAAPRSSSGAVEPHDVGVAVEAGVFDDADEGDLHAYGIAFARRGPTATACSPQRTRDEREPCACHAPARRADTATAAIAFSGRRNGPARCRRCATCCGVHRWRRRGRPCGRRRGHPPRATRAAPAR